MNSFIPKPFGSRRRWCCHQRPVDVYRSIRRYATSVDFNADIYSGIAGRIVIGDNTNNGAAQ